MSEPVVVNLRHLAREVGVPFEQVQPVVELLDDGHPVPFIARYRKDRTGNLDEEKIRQIQDELNAERMLAERKQTILRSIDSLGKLTPELDQKIRDAKTAKRLEDIYLPYKPKKQTLASVAKSKGLEPLALEILGVNQDTGVVITDLEARAAEFVNADKGVNSVADALLGAGHILSELFSEKIELRQQVRDIVHRSGVLVSKKIETKAAETKKTEPKKEKKEKAATSAAAAPEAENAAAESETVESAATPAPQTESAPVAEAVTTPAAEDKATPTESTAATTPATEPAEDSCGAGGGELEEISDSDSAEAGEGSDESNTVSTEIELGSTGVHEVTETSAPTPAAKVEATSTETAVAAASENVDEKTEAGKAGAGEGGVDAEAAEVGRQFEDWKERQKEQDTPVVVSQNREKKKKKAEKKKEKVSFKAKQQEHFEKLFHDYFDFSSQVKKLPPHRVLALNRGEKSKVIRVKLDVNDLLVSKTATEICVPSDHKFPDYMTGCVKDAIDRLVLPAMERELRNDLTDQAETQAVRVFAKNLRNLLLQPPLNRKKVLALDPGYKHGCKIVALDEFGNVLDYTTVYLAGSEEKRKAAAETVIEFLTKFKIPVIAIGNGTGCRETEEFISKIIEENAEQTFAPIGLDVSYIIVNEAGASVYSASPIAKEEFPDYDPLLRGAISIGRRLQDPLNELVKVEPVSLGVGMYQHDLKAKHLRDTLNDVVESCVNFVGVDLNTATPEILKYVAGLNQLTAKRIYDYRIENGPFKTREELKNVPGLGDITFSHCAGFLRITDGPNPLDATWIHPEMYEKATSILNQLGFSVDDLKNSEKAKEIAEKTKTADVNALAETLQIGPHTVTDILAQLAKPGRDPREELPAPIFKKGVLKMEDLVPEMELNGTILNVVDFGAFVDIGVHETGLIHISQLADRYIQDAHEYVAVGDIVRVWVVEVDPERGRISLTMLPPGTQRREEHRRDWHKQGDGKGEHGHGREKADSDKTEERYFSKNYRDKMAQRQAEGEQGGAGGATSAEGASKPRFERKSRDSRGGSQERKGGEARGTGAPRQDSSDRGKERGSWKRDGGRDRSRYEVKPKTFVAGPKEKVIKPISDDMKKGKEPLRSFGDLAQLFGRVQAVDPAEEKRKKKEEQKAKKQDKAENAPTQAETHVESVTEQNAESEA
ncbi:MAG: Tex-like N-terminal domain-containing protein [Thermoguttaceae bacterium]